MSSRGKGGATLKSATLKPRVVKEQGMTPVQTAFAAELTERHANAHRLISMAAIRKATSGKNRDGEVDGTKAAVFKLTTLPYVNLEVNGALKRIILEAIPYAEQKTSANGKKKHIRIGPGAIAYACLKLGCLPNGILPRALVPGELDETEETNMMNAYAELTAD